jgi:hypothetical protein
MPMIIPHIDAIARAKQRDVLYVEFRCREYDDGNGFVIDTLDQDWRKLPVRQQIIDWLDEHQIGWHPCGHFASENMYKAYCGEIYIDLPYDTSLPVYRDLEAFLENPDGSMRLPDCGKRRSEFQGRLEKFEVNP